jgi:hypothetical protein
VAAGMGALVYLSVMFLLGGFNDHELSLVKNIYLESEIASSKLLRLKQLII